MKYSIYNVIVSKTYESFQIIYKQQKYESVGKKNKEGENNINNTHNFLHNTKYRPIIHHIL